MHFSKRFCQEINAIIDGFPSFFVRTLALFKVTSQALHALFPGLNWACGRSLSKLHTKETIVTQSHVSIQAHFTGDKRRSLLYLVKYNPGMNIYYHIKTIKTNFSLLEVHTINHFIFNQIEEAKTETANKRLIKLTATRSY